jgi:membrane protein YqaA with SNARE-associated domain
VSLLTIVAALVFASAVFRDSMMTATEWIYESIGIGGLLALLFVTDALITPIPPDAILVVIANSPLRDQADWLIVGIGALSAVAGNVGWWIGSSLGNTPWVSKRLERSRRKHQKLLTRYGGWAVALGAVTPVPFSVTCWSAGALGVPFRIVAPMTLLRFPRFVLFYVAIAYAGDFGTWLTR